MNRMYKDYTLDWLRGYEPRFYTKSEVAEVYDFFDNAEDGDIIPLDIVRLLKLEELYVYGSMVYYRTFKLKEGEESQ